MAYKTPKHVEEQKQIKKERILEAAARVFSTKGYHGTTVKDIVEEASISVGSFYFYFKSKEEIFEKLLDVMVANFYNAGEEAVQGADTLEKQVEIGITTFLRLIETHSDLAKIMLIEAVGINPNFEKKRVEKLEFFTYYIKNKLDEAMAKGEIDTIDTNITAYAYTGAIMNIITHWLSLREPKNLLDAAPALIKFNQQGLGIK